MPVPTTMFGLGSFLLIVGGIILIAGLEQIKVNPDKSPIAIPPGKGRVTVGIILIFIGGYIIFKSPEVNPSTPIPTPIPTTPYIPTLSPTPILPNIVIPTATPAKVSQPIPTFTPIMELSPTPTVKPTSTVTIPPQVTPSKIFVPCQFKVNRILIQNTQGKKLEYHHEDLYVVKLGENLKFFVDVTYSKGCQLSIVWQADYGEVKNISDFENTYVAQQEGGDTVRIYMLDQLTGQEEISVITMNIIP